MDLLFKFVVRLAGLVTILSSYHAKHSTNNLLSLEVYKLLILRRCKAIYRKSTVKHTPHAYQVVITIF